MPSADLVIHGTVRTVDEAKPTAAALAVSDGRLVAVGERADIESFNTAAAQRAGLSRDTPDPKGALFGRDANGDLDGTAEEAGAVWTSCATVSRLDSGHTRSPIPR